MAVTILMPKLGLTMTAGAVALWIAEEGQRVSVGEIIVEVITEKITYQMEAQASGTLLKIVVEEGEEVPVGTVIGIIGEPHEDITGLLGGNAVRAGAPGETSGGAPAGAPGAASGAGAGAPGTSIDRQPPRLPRRGRPRPRLPPGAVGRRPRAPGPTHRPPRGSSLPNSVWTSRV